jgi:hypothetical protein
MTDELRSTVQHCVLSGGLGFSYGDMLQKKWTQDVAMALPATSFCLANDSSSLEGEAPIRPGGSSFFA